MITWLHSIECFYLCAEQFYAQLKKCFPTIKTWNLFCCDFVEITAHYRICRGCSDLCFFPLNSWPCLCSQSPQIIFWILFHCNWIFCSVWWIRTVITHHWLFALCVSGKWKSKSPRSRGRRPTRTSLWWTNNCSSLIMWFLLSAYCYLNELCGTFFGAFVNLLLKCLCGTWLCSCLCWRLWDDPEMPNVPCPD
jgi:hypothetical protein